MCDEKKTQGDKSSSNSKDCFKELQTTSHKLKTTVASFDLKNQMPETINHKLKIPLLLTLYLDELTRFPSGPAIL